jgi:hypothetical protein
MDGVEQPADRAEFEYGDLDRARRTRGLPEGKARYGAKQKS